MKRTQTKRTVNFAESKKGNEDRYGKDGWMAKLKSLITEILEEESGDFSFIIKKLCEEKRLAYSDLLERRVKRVLRDWNEGLKKDKEGSSNGRVKEYSLE